MESGIWFCPITTYGSIHPSSDMAGSLKGLLRGIPLAKPSSHFHGNENIMARVNYICSMVLMEYWNIYLHFALTKSPM